MPAEVAGKQTRSVAVGAVRVLQKVGSPNAWKPVLGPIHDVVQLGVCAATGDATHGHVVIRHTTATITAVGLRQRSAGEVDTLGYDVRLTTTIVRSSTGPRQERYWYVLYQWICGRLPPRPTGRSCFVSHDRPPH
jgi:hypothetical protein